MSLFSDPRDGRRALLSLIDDGEHLIELRGFCDSWPKPRKRWAQGAAAADAIAASLTPRGVDVHVGMAPRLGRQGADERRYAPLRVLWADCDTERSVARLGMFEPPPTGAVLSGGIDGSVRKRHAWWALTDPMPADDARRHLLRLAHHLDADLASCDAARVLRLPGSRHRKTGRVATLASFTGETYSLEEIVGGLPDAPAHKPPVVLDGDQLRVPLHLRHHALCKYLGWLRSLGWGEAALVAFTDMFLDHLVEIDEARCPLDREHARDTARWFADNCPPHRTNGGRR
jgi:hypothetical protein